MTQAVASSPKGSPRVLLAGASGGSIFIWEKVAVRESSPVKTSTIKKATHSPPQGDTNLKLILAFVLLATYANWAPPMLSVSHHLRVGSLVY